MEEVILNSNRKKSFVIVLSKEDPKYYANLYKSIMVG